MSETLKKEKETVFNLIEVQCRRQCPAVFEQEERKSKGSEINYSDIELADLLQPINPMSIEQKQKLFSIRNRMVQISDNFPKSEMKTKCFCGENEDMKHIYTCNIRNEGIGQTEKYGNICNGTISQQTKNISRI